MTEPSPPKNLGNGLSYERLVGKLVEKLSSEEREQLKKNIGGNLTVTVLLLLFYGAVLSGVGKPVFGWVTPGNFPVRPISTWVTVGLLPVLSFWSILYYFTVLSRIEDSWKGKVITCILPLSFGACVVWAFQRPSSQYYPLGIGALLLTLKAFQLSWHIKTSLSDMSDQSKLHFRYIFYAFGVVTALLLGVAVVVQFQLFPSGEAAVSAAREHADNTVPKTDVTGQALLDYVKETDERITGLTQYAVALCAILGAVFATYAVWRAIRESSPARREDLLNDLEGCYARKRGVAQMLRPV